MTDVVTPTVQREVLEHLVTWGGARTLHCRLGTVMASSMLQTVEWSDVPGKLVERGEQGADLVQVDAEIVDERVVICQAGGRADPA